ncbi:unnamed protein product [Acanthoscelides obtectus]|uniref:Uncharacterized protein n=1 Tax=Acanthoscelides obtectus TaxID=200917 RepID=A0A9P0LWH5_ACAOB|nr:unnamed protein product [Acanthoscelides obtectus]CAK1621546.1 hypothetical protein AOBTE_LOCUS1007 [Acanthoscelides obtectus]
MAACRLMTNLALDVYQLPESTKMLKKFESLCCRPSTDNRSTIREEVAAKFLNQKEHRVETCRALKQQLESDRNFLSKIITGDEPWCYVYDPETKQQSSQWYTPRHPVQKNVVKKNQTSKQC